MKAGPVAIDIIVPVYKSVALTARCLHSLAANIHELSRFSVRLVVINDSPGDLQVAQLLSSFAADYSFTQVVTNEANLGFVKTANRGLHLACDEGRDVILVNADTETYSGTLSCLVQTAYADPLVGFVSPRSNNASFCSLPHPSGPKMLSQAEAYDRWKTLSRTMPQWHFVPTAVGFYLYIKREVLANVGFLDTCFGAGYEEENDLIQRASKVGYRAVVANHAFAYHAGSASFNLTDLDLDAQRDNNLLAITKRHPEFLPLVRRYEQSPHFRAEVLLGYCLPSSRGALRVVFDLSSLGCDYNGTSEFTVAVLSSLCRRHGTTFDLNVLCSRVAFEFHGLDAFANLHRLDPHVLPSERFAIAVRLGQPFDLDAVSRLGGLASVNIYVMHDTIALDCGHLSLANPLDALWGHVAKHANGICYVSQFAQRCFESRFPEAATVRKYTHLSSTRLEDYGKNEIQSRAEHVLILGNHFAHKASHATAEILKDAFPTMRFVLLGKDTRTVDNVSCYKAGMLSEEEVARLYAHARIVVLPSYLEGFGLGLVHALAARKVVVARDLPATREILATYRSVSGVFLYQDNLQLVTTLQAALEMTASQVDDSDARSWNDWADGFAEFCRLSVAADDLFPRLVERIKACDLLRAGESGREANAHRSLPPVVCRSLRELLACDGEEFVHAAYWTVFNRGPDTEGLENYTAELDAGISKFKIIARLRNSEEGRRKNLRLVGFRRAYLARRLLSSEVK